VASEDIYWHAENVPTQHDRGGHATGVAFRDKTGTWHNLKIEGDARAFRKAYPQAGVGANVAIVHTRYATQGSPSKQVNNHPIQTGAFIGVHNGHISNDAEIFATVPFTRHGEVDSEAFVALVRNAHMKGGPVTHELERLEGRAAVAWVNTKTKTPTLHVARVNTSPLIVAQTERGSVVFASTRHAVLESMKAVGLVAAHLYEVPEGTYMRFTDRGLRETLTFKVPKTVFWGRAADQRTRKPKPVKAAPKRAKITGTIERYDSNVYTSVWDSVDVDRKPSLHDIPSDMSMFGNDPDQWPDWNWDDDDFLRLATVRKHSTSWEW
jgi:asparagine synthetase B (glutamine-hydrolysing)